MHRPFCFRHVCALHFEAALVPPTDERFRPAALQRVPSPNFVCIVHRLNSLYAANEGPSELIRLAKSRI